MSVRVIVVGGVNVDLVVTATRLPGPGETVTGGTFEQHPGGKGGNQAVAAARLGADVRMIGAVGDDAFGAGARAALVAEGIDVSGLATDPEAPTGIALILVDATGENLISVASGANQAFGPAAVQAGLAHLGSLVGDVVLVSNEIARPTVAAVLRAASAAGARMILNPAPAAGIEATWLQHVDLLTPNRGELAALAGFASPDLDPRGAAEALSVREAVIVTLGPNGALVLPAEGEPWPAPAIPVEVVDTTGAGDAFNGALAAALADGRPLDEAVRRAVAAGGLATTRVGAREGMPTAAELEAALGG